MNLTGQPVQPRVVAPPFLQLALQALDAGACEMLCNPSGTDAQNKMLGGSG